MTVTKTQKIYDEIIRRITDGEYSPRDILTERSLAAEFNVSKTPVRECLSNLCLEGYLEKYPNCGYLIKELSFADAVALAEMRVIVESAAVKIVIQYASDEEIKSLYQYLDNDEYSNTIGPGRNTSFHTGIARLTHNPFIEDTVRSLAMRAKRSSKILQDEDIAELHAKILKAIEERNVEDAVRYIVQDISLKGQREI